MSEQALDTILENAATLIAEDKKIISSVSRYPLYNDEPQIYSYLATYPRNKDNHKNTDSSAGFSFSRKLALMRVLGEGLERYCLDNFKVTILANCSTKELKQPHLEPKAFSPFSQSQLLDVKLKKFKISTNAKFQWAKSTSLLTGQTILVPAQLVSFNYTYLKHEPSITVPLSTGVATGINLDIALYSAICEVVERDSFMISYLNKLPSPKIVLNHIRNSKFKEILSIFKRYRLELTVLDLKTDLEIPSFAAVVVDRTGLGPAVSLGLKTGFDEESAIIGAIEESLMTRSWCRDKFIYSKQKDAIPKIITNIDDRAHFWFSTEMIEKLKFWLIDNKNIKKILHRQSSKKSLDKIKEIFKKKHIEILYADITPKKIKRAGFVVVRVIIPQLQQLYLDERYKFLGNERLYKIPMLMGHTTVRHTEQELNIIPHPFL